MTGGKRFRRRRRNLLGSHQKCWIWGRHLVRETLRAGRWIPLEVWISSDSEAGEELATLAESLGVPLSAKLREEMTRRCGSLEHQGAMARMPPYPFVEFDDVLRAASSSPLLLVLDRVQDPQNFGAIIRSAEVFGLDGLVIGSRGQCDVTAAVARSSAGAVNHVPIARVDDLVDAARGLRECGLAVLATSGEAETPLDAADLTRPTALMIGNEGAGVSPELIRNSDAVVRIPQYGTVGSLNAAVAAGILCYEARRQRAAVAETRSPPTPR